MTLNQQSLNFQGKSGFKIEFGNDAIMQHDRLLP